MKKSIALFGGSFSPVHRGHLGVASAIAGRRLADEVWFVPCRRNPLKEHSPALTDDERLRLLHKAINYAGDLRPELKGKLKVSDVELTMPEPSFTCDTLEALTERYPDCRFRIVVGADSYLDFEKWRNWEWIESNFSPIVYPRPGYDIENLKPSWTLIEDVETVDVSSTELRRLLEMMPWVRE